MCSVVVILPAPLHAMILMLWLYLSLVFDDTILFNIELIDGEVGVDNTIWLVCNNY